MCMVCSLAGQRYLMWSDGGRRKESCRACHGYLLAGTTIPSFERPPRGIGGEVRGIRAHGSAAHCDMPVMALWYCDDKADTSETPVVVEHNVDKSIRAFTYDSCDEMHTAVTGSWTVPHVHLTKDCFVDSPLHGLPLVWYMQGLRSRQLVLWSCEIREEGPWIRECHNGGYLPMCKGEEQRRDKEKPTGRCENGGYRRWGLAWVELWKG